MNAGLPGTGIGGFFYLLTALLIPFIELYQTVRGKSSLKRWRFAIRQTIIAWGIIIGMGFAGWSLKSLFHLNPRTSLILRIHGQNFIILHSNSFLLAIPFLLSFLTLLFVFTCIIILRLLFIIRRREKPIAC